MLSYGLVRDAEGFRGGIKQMYEEGLLGPDTTYIHCCTLSDDELKYIVDIGGTFSIATAVEMQMRHGMPPLDRILRLGARPSLSVDVETNVPGDMFTQMRAAFQCQRALVNQRAIMLRADRLNVFPLNDPVGAVVAGADTGNVDSVFIAGRAMKRNGQLVNVDLERARKLALDSRDDVVARAGFTLPAF